MRTKILLPGCAALFTFFTFSLLGEYLSLLLSNWLVPWWVYLIILFAVLESAYFAAYVISPRTPFSLTLIELASFMLPLYFLSRQTANKFLPLAIFTLAAWLVARDYGTKIVQMEKAAAFLGDQAASTISWEYESLADRGFERLTIEYFWDRFLFFSIALIIFGISSRKLILEPFLNGRLALLGSGFLFSGLFLLGLAYLFRLQILWGYAQAQIQSSLVKRWLKGLGALVLILVLLINLAPLNYSPLTAEQVGKGLETLLGRWQHSPQSLPEPPEQAPQLEAGEGISQLEGEPSLAGLIFGILFLLLGLLLAIVLLVVIAGSLILLLAGEAEKVKGLPRLLVSIYTGIRETVSNLFRWFQGTPWEFSQLGDVKQGAEEVSQAPQKKRRLRKRRFLGIRGMFLRIIRTGRAAGLPYLPSQTAGEYGEQLAKRVEPALVNKFFSGYQQVRYGNKVPKGSEEKLWLQAGEKIIKQLKDGEKGVKD